MKKFGRSYRLTIDPKDGGDLIVLTLPLTINFTVEKHNLSDQNTCNIEVYNLSENLRNRIFKDRYNINVRRTIVFEIGYEYLTTVFKGDIWEASSARQGTDIITMIESRDANVDVISTTISETYSSGKTMEDMFKFLIGKFPNLSVGGIGDFGPAPLRPITVNGNVWEIIKRYSQSQCFIEDGKVYVMKNNEYIDTEVAVLGVETGLLDTPRRDETFLTVTTLLEPGIRLMQLAELKSLILPVYNAKRQVVGVTHQGTISASVGGACRSIFSLNLGSEVFGKAVPVEQL